MKKKIITDPMGQWKYPGKNTRIPSNNITMKGVNYPVLGVSNNGKQKMMYPGQDYIFPGADYVDEFPQMKKGGRPRGLVPMPKPSKKGLASKKYSRSLDATNRLFAENKLFEKPKSRRNKIFDPRAKYYQDGGIPYSNLPITYQSALRNFVYPNAIDDPENAGYNSINNTISYDSQSPIENMSNDWWREHEVFHDLQNQAGGMSTLGVVGQRPNPYVASDESIQGYYNRRDADVERTINSMIAQDPSLQFIPREKLAQSNFDEETGEPIFVGAEDLQYSDPSTLEGEARQYEQYIREGNPSIFPKNKMVEPTELN